MTTKRKARHVVAKADGMRLWWTPKTDKWEMTGGKWGKHYLVARCYTARVHAHWTGYLANNGVKAKPDNYPIHLMR